MDKWHQLWTIATAEPEGCARIIVDPEDEDVVTLEFPDGGKAALYWHYNADRWEFGGALDTAPCDVAARDSL